jgi:hypothetical protein
MSKAEVESMVVALQKLIEDVEIAEGVLKLRLAPLLEAKAWVAIWHLRRDRRR